MVDRAETHRAQVVPNLSRIVALCVSICLFATFDASVVVPRSPFFGPLFSACNSNHNLGVAVTNWVRPVFCLTAPRRQKFRGVRCSRLRGSFQPFGGGRKCTGTDRRGFIEGGVVSLGGRPRYCASNARSAADIVGPIPTMLSFRLDPSCAIQRSPRKHSSGWCTAAGLPGCSAQ